MDTQIPRAARDHDAIEVRNLGKIYPSQDRPVQALADVSFAIGDAEFVTIVGHSGCGKSTLLRIIAGLSAPSSGEVKVRGRNVTAQIVATTVAYGTPRLGGKVTMQATVSLPVSTLTPR